MSLLPLLMHDLTYVFTFTVMGMVMPVAGMAMNMAMGGG